MNAPKLLTNIDGLNWDVAEASLSDGIGELPEHKTLRRTDNNLLLNVCRKSYTPFKNEEFTGLVKEVLEAAGGAYEFKEYTEWKGGKTIMAHLEQKEDFDLCGWDSDNYLVIGNAHDGSRSLFVGHTNKLLRCSNQFGSICTDLKIRHSRSIVSRANEFARVVKLYKAKQDYLKEIMEQAIDIKIDKNLIQAGIFQVMDLGRAKTLNPDEMGTKRKNSIGKIEASIAKETGELGSNLFGLFNGFTHYTTHSYKGQYRQNSELLGTEQRQNARGFAFVEQQVELAKSARTLVTV